MRWISFIDEEGRSRTGVVTGSSVHALAPGQGLLDILDEGPAGLASSGAALLESPESVFDVSEVRLTAPFEPRSIRDTAGFLQHLRNVRSRTGNPIDERYSRYPPFYFQNVAAVVGPTDDVKIFPGSSQFDYELEVGAVIGVEAANVPLEDAENCVVGYVMLCDWSARDIQMDEMTLRLGPAKGKDGCTTIGPTLVTKEEIEGYRKGKGFDLGMRAYINGELVSEGTWSSIDWGFDDMITYASRGTRVRPGDIIGSGTVATGCLFEHFALDPDGFRGWLEPGDEVRLVVDELGELKHRIIEADRAHPLSSGH